MPDVGSTAILRWGPVGEFEPLHDGSALPPASRARVGRLRRPADRHDVETAHRLAHEVVRRVAPGAEIVQECTDCGVSGHGRPRLVGRPDVGLSWSHADGWVAVLVVVGAADHAVVGVDVEPVRRAWPERVFTGAEHGWADAQREPGVARTVLWTRKEALVKVGAVVLDEVGVVELVSAGSLVDEWLGWVLRSQTRQEALPESGLEEGDGPVAAVCSWAVRAPSGSGDGRHLTLGPINVRVALPK